MLISETPTPELTAPSVAATFPRQPLMLGEQPSLLHRSRSLSPSQLADAHWLILTLLIQESDEAWAWAIPILQDASTTPVAMEHFLDAVYSPCRPLVDMLKAQIISKAFCPGSQLDLGYQGSAAILHVDGHPTARIMQVSFPIKGRGELGEASTLLSWIDGGLRDAFPLLPPMQGPYSASILKAGEFTFFPTILGESAAAMAQLTKQRVDAKMNADAIVQLIPAIARSAVEARDIEAATHTPPPNSPHPPTPRL